MVRRRSLLASPHSHASSSTSSSTPSHLSSPSNDLDDLLRTHVSKPSNATTRAAPHAPSIRTGETTAKRRWQQRCKESEDRKRKGRRDRRGKHQHSIQTTSTLLTSPSTLHVRARAPPLPTAAQHRTSAKRIGRLARCVNVTNALTHPLAETATLTSATPALRCQKHASAMLKATTTREEERTYVPLSTTTTRTSKRTQHRRPATATKKTSSESSTTARKKHNAPATSSLSTAPHVCEMKRTCSARCVHVLNSLTHHFQRRRRRCYAADPVSASLTATTTREERTYRTPLDDDDDDENDSTNAATTCNCNVRDRRQQRGRKRTGNVDSTLAGSDDVDGTRQEKMKSRGGRKRRTGKEREGQR